MKMPIVESYRNVGIHDFQNRERIEQIVKPAIDRIYEVTDTDFLIDYAGDFYNPAEARLFAAAKVQASRELKAADHETRDKVDLARLKASTAGLNSLTWSDPTCYRSICDAVSHAPGIKVARRREHHARRMVAAQETNRL